jgi:hypothetical protein
MFEKYRLNPPTPLFKGARVLVPLLRAGLIHPPEKNSFNPFVSLNLDQLSMEVQRSN